jgi:hypothetical protein
MVSHRDCRLTRTNRDNSAQFSTDTDGWTDDDYGAALNHFWSFKAWLESADQDAAKLRMKLDCHLFRAVFSSEIALLDQPSPQDSISH